MTRLPQPGSDDGQWGDILNDFLSVAHNADGTLKSGAVGTTQIQNGSVSTIKLSPGVQNSLNNADSAVQSNIVTTKGDLLVATGNGTLTRLGVGSNNQILTADSNQASGVRWAGAASGGITRSIFVIASSTAAGSTASTDYTYFINGAATLTLPTAINNANRYSVTNTHSANVTIATTSSQTINGSTTISLILGQSVDLVSNGASWGIF
jgi:hypothetical protein